MRKAVALFPEEEQEDEEEEEELEEEMLFLFLQPRSCRRVRI